MASEFLELLEVYRTAANRNDRLMGECSVLWV